MRRARAFYLENRDAIFDGRDLCLHLALKGRSKSEEGNRSQALVPNAFFVRNLGTPHRLNATSGSVTVICLPDGLVGDERFGEWLAPPDFKIERAASRFIEASVRGSDQEERFWAEEIL